MGAFHCPVGAVGQGAAGCVGCGLCTARTAAERVAAAKVIRASIRASAVQTTPKIQKICVCGKGGVGKSTVVSLFARALEQYGHKVLVIDTDESNPSLCRRLAMPEEPEPLLKLLERFADDDCIPDENWLARNEYGMDDIPSQFVAQRENIRLIMSGKVMDPLQGCACGMADITREIMQNIVLKKDEVLLADLEAGVESFGRGVEQGADTVLVLVEPSYDSVELAAKIQYMAEGIGILRVRAIMNKIPSAKIEKQIQSMLIEKGIRFLGSFMINDEIASASLTGTPIPPGTAYDKALHLVRLMLDEAEMD